MIQTSRWDQNKSSVLPYQVRAGQANMELLFWCQREVWINEMCHPVDIMENATDDRDKNHLDCPDYSFNSWQYRLFAQTNFWVEGVIVAVVATLGGYSVLWWLDSVAVTRNFKIVHYNKVGTWTVYARAENVDLSTYYVKIRVQILYSGCISWHQMLRRRDIFSATWGWIWLRFGRLLNTKKSWENLLLADLLHQKGTNLNYISGLRL